jgi:hypothetical protein
MDIEELRQVRQTVVRRARFALNALALSDDTMPPEGAFDTALTNGLVAIVSHEWPGREREGRRMRSARQLLGVINEQGGSRWADVDGEVLSQGLDITQPFRHGRADDEWASVGRIHVEAVLALDGHPSLAVLDRARQHREYGDLLHALFSERAEEELPFDPKERSIVPDPDVCDECRRPTFIREGWDMFGGELSEGICIACGYERDHETAYRMAVDHRLEQEFGRD